ncbi:TetR/AcrR family transcriptional regulator [Micromonospora sp. NPDC050417]|uniref:TetR/AcrR family transcriptional regulator n=1 Tax=Micromonospora sp. NPDC050417 TaxID=3364280 RepID=UPI003796A227
MTTEYTSGGDPARSIALLWRGPEKPAPRSGLTVDRIVDTAIELADADGLAALSMRKLAERLGVGVMTLYTYVPSRAELVDVMLDTALGRMARPDQSTLDWRGRLEQIARENLATYQRHPWMIEVAVQRPPMGPHLIAKYDYELRALTDIGLTEVEMDSVLTLLLGYVAGAARGAVEAALVERRTGMTDEQWWAVQAPLLEQVLDPGSYPVASAVGSAAGEANQGTYEPTRAFEFGLERVLDGIEVFVRRTNPSGIH